MRYFRLLTGAHEGAAPDWTPPPEAEFRKLHPTAPYPPEPPSVKYRAGDVVPYDGDLREKFGHDRFQEVGQPRSAAKAHPPGAVSTATIPPNGPSEPADADTPDPHGPAPAAADPLPDPTPEPTFGRRGHRK